MLNRLLFALGLCALTVACGQTNGDVDAGTDASGASGSSDAAGVKEGGVFDAHGGAATDSSAGTSGATPDAGPIDGSVPKDAAPDAQPPLDGSTPLPHPYRALQVTAGALHACALLEDHRVKCWGDNFVGQLGYGDTRSRGKSLDEMGDALPFVDLGTGRTARAIAAGRYTTCAILDDDTVKCWGYNEGYEPSGMSHGEAPGQMGDQLPTVDLGVGRKATHVAVREFRGCIALDDGTARCWGTPEASYDLHAAAPVRQMSASANGVVILLEGGSVISLPQNTSETIFGTTAIGGSPAGWCAVGAAGGLSCYPTELGWSQIGAQNLIGVGVGDISSRFLCTLRSDGAVSCWGSDFDLGDCSVGSSATSYWCDSDHHTVDLGQPATSITTDSRGFECALLANGAIKCWGNSAGNFGVLGASVESTTDGGAISPVLWHSIDLGTLR